MTQVYVQPQLRHNNAFVNLLSCKLGLCKMSLCCFSFSVVQYIHLSEPSVCVYTLMYKHKKNLIQFGR